MLGLKLNHVSKRGPWWHNRTWIYISQPHYIKAAYLFRTKHSTSCIWLYSPCDGVTILKSYLFIYAPQLMPRKRDWQGIRTLMTNYIQSLIARFMGPTWGHYGADRTQVGPMLAPWMLLSGLFMWGVISSSSRNFISRIIQQNTFHMHNISTKMSQMYFCGGCKRSWEVHQADNCYIIIIQL